MSSLKRFVADTGGYQLPQGEAEGHQILINYRSSKFRQVSLRNLLNHSLDAQLPDLVQERIILVGVNYQDLHQTPYSQGRWPEKMPGVVVHAHMISQILSAVLDRPLL